MPKYSLSVLSGRLIIVLMVLTSAFLLVSGDVDAQEPEMTVVHRVVAGETLWTIATAIRDDQETAVPILVAVIRDLNELETSSLQIGQELLLPA